MINEASKPELYDKKSFEDKGLGPNIEYDIRSSEDKGLGPNIEYDIRSSEDKGLGPDIEYDIRSFEDKGLGPNIEYDIRSSEDKGLGPITDMKTYMYMNDITHKTDDNGNVYCTDGKLKPNNTYILNGNKYTTDNNGRIISVESKPIINPENTRNNNEQTQVGGKDRRPNDQGGHIIGRDMNGDGGIGNLLPMDGIINQSDYKRMENEVKKKLENGENVTTNTKVIYNGDSSRPDNIITTIEVDGKKDTVWKFDNNIDGALMKEVPENGKNIVQDKVNETGGEISSIKEKYDEKGNLVETTVYITYKDENGNNRKASVIIEK